MKKTNAKTFIDDVFLRTKPEKNQNMLQAIHCTLEKVDDYMKANKLKLNPQKSQIMLFSEDQDLKKNFKITLNKKEIRHSPEMTVLGNKISDTLSWDPQRPKSSFTSPQKQGTYFKNCSKVPKRGFQSTIC